MEEYRKNWKSMKFSKLQVEQAEELKQVTFNAQTTTFSDASKRHFRPSTKPMASIWKYKKTRESKVTS